MNKARRQEIRELLLRIEAVKNELSDIQGNLEIVRDDEQDAFDNMPESIQYSERGERMEETIDGLEEQTGAIEEAWNALDEITTALEDIIEQ